MRPPQPSSKQQTLVNSTLQCWLSASKETHFQHSPESAAGVLKRTGRRKVADPISTPFLKVFPLGLHLLVIIF